MSAVAESAAGVLDGASEVLADVQCGPVSEITEFCRLRGGCHWWCEGDVGGQFNEARVGEESVRLGR
jgi:hypothetical protein